MFKSAAIKLLNIYKNVLDIQINEKDFFKGSLIKSFNIDSLIALQLIAEIEKNFNFIIEDDELAIKIIDSPFYFFNYYQCYKLKNIYESVLNMQIDESEIVKENLIEKMNIDNQKVSIIIAEIEKCFQININDAVNAADIVNFPLSFLNTFQEVSII